jgi:hypothetical protein
MTEKKFSDGKFFMEMLSLVQFGDIYVHTTGALGKLSFGVDVGFVREIWVV